MTPRASSTVVLSLRTPLSPADQDPYTLAFNSLPYELVHLPLLSTTFTNLDHLHVTIKTRASHYSGVIITSARAVQAWSRAAAASPSSNDDDHKDDDDDWSSKPFFVVGTPTRDALLSLPPDARPTSPSHVLGADSTHTGDRLAHFIVEYFTRRRDDTATEEEQEQRPLLWLVGDKNSDTIPTILAQHGHDTRVPPCDKLQVYATGLTYGFRAEFERVLERVARAGRTGEREEQGEKQDNRSPSPRQVWIGLFSPSGAREVVPMLRDLGLLPSSSSSSSPPPRSTRLGRNLRVRLATIGSVTTRYLVEEQDGLKPDAEAVTPDAPGLEQAIRRVIQRESESKSDVGP